MSIASEISRLQGAKADIKTAIEGKGVTVPSATKLDGYADLVDAIPQGSTPTGTKQISVTQNGTQTENVSGYASAQLNVSVPNTYTAGDEGKVVDSGALVAQTAHADVTPTTSDQTIDTTTNNSIKVKGDADLVASNIKKDVEIFGVTGSYEGGGGGASAQDILLGLAPSGAATVTANANIPSGAMCGRQNLTELTVEFSGNYNLATRCINYCPSLAKIVIDYGETRQTTQCGEYAISFNNALEQLIIRGDMMSLEANGFRSNTALELVDIESAWNTNGFCGGNAFSGSSNLKKLILRQTSAPIAIRSTSLAGTGFAGANGAIAYVPSALISSYQSASNWSTLYNNGYVTFSALENSVYANIDWYKS